MATETVPFLPTERRAVTIGFWFPFSDQVTWNQFEMQLAYQLYPAKVVLAQPENLARLDLLIGYRMYLCQLIPALEKAGLGAALVDFTPAEKLFFLLGNRLDTPAPVARQSDVVAVAPDACGSCAAVCFRFLRLLLALLLPLPLGWLLLWAFEGRSVVGVRPSVCGDSRVPRKSGTTNGGRALHTLKDELQRGVWRRLEFTLFAWVAGILLLVLLLPPLCMLGLPVTLGAFALFYAVLVMCAGAWAWLQNSRFSGPTVRGAIVPATFPAANLAPVATLSHCLAVTLVFTAALAWGGLLVAEAVASPMFDITGVGIWGLKAKAFVASGGLDWFLLTDPAYAFCQQNYPLGFPLLLAWCQCWMGAYDDWLIRLVPVTLGMGVGGLLFIFLRRRGIGLAWSGLLTLLFCSGEVFSRQSTFVQAETLLLLLGLAGAFLLAEWLRSPQENRQLWLGLLFLAGAAGVKQEGLVYFAVLAALAVFLKHRRAADHASKKYRFRDSLAIAEIMAVVAVFALFIVPWLVWCRWQQLPLNDFSLAAVWPRPLRVGLECWRDGLWVFGRQMFWALSSTALIWVGGMLLAAWSWPYRKSQKALACAARRGAEIGGGRDAHAPFVTATPSHSPTVTLFLTGAALLLVLFFGTAYVLSVFVEMGRFEWHLQASGRLLLFPTALFLAGVANRNR